MTKLLRCALTLAFGFSLSCCAQTPGTPTVGPGNTAGLLYASNFGLWQVPQGNTGQYSWSSPSFCTVSAAGIPLAPVFAVGTPVFIKDHVVANSEIVTPSAINVGGAGCSITVSPVNKHNTFTLTSATGGLQEAINYAHALPYQVILTPDWSRLGGTTGMILAAKGNSNVQILDQRGSCLTAYIWSGSAYAAQPSSCGGGSSGIISVNSQTGPSVTFQSSGATVAITNPSPNVINLESSGGGGGGCSPSGVAGDYLVDGGNGTCLPANANYSAAGPTRGTINYSNFGKDDLIEIASSSCDSTVCTLLGANDLDMKTSGRVYVGAFGGLLSSCLADSGYVTVVSITPTQIVIDENDTGCTGIVDSGNGEIVGGLTDVVVLGDFSVGASYSEYESQIALNSADFYVNTFDVTVAPAVGQDGGDFFIHPSAVGGAPATAEFGIRFGLEKISLNGTTGVEIDSGSKISINSGTAMNLATASPEQLTANGSQICTTSTGCGGFGATADPSTGIVAGLSTPWDAVFDSNNNSIYVLNIGNRTVSVMNEAGQITGTIGGFLAPFGDTSRGHLILFDSHNNSVYTIGYSPGGVQPTVSVIPDSGTTIAGTISGLSTGVTGGVFDPHNNKLYFVAGDHIYAVDDSGMEVTETIDYPMSSVSAYGAIVFDSHNNSLYISVNNQNSSSPCALYGGAMLYILPDSGTSITGYVCGPMGITGVFDPHNNTIYVAGNGEIAVIPDSGTSITGYISSYMPSYLEFDSGTNSILAVGYRGQRIELSQHHPRLWDGSH